MIYPTTVPPSEITKRVNISYQLVEVLVIKKSTVTTVNTFLKTYARLNFMKQDYLSKTILHHFFFAMSIKYLLYNKMNNVVIK